MIEIHECYELALLVHVRSDDGEHLVRLKGQPAHGEHGHHEHEHLHGLLLVAQDAVVAPLILLSGNAVPPEVLRKTIQRLRKLEK